MEFQVSDAVLLHRYRFGGRTAEFLLCRSCGVYVGAQMTTENGRYGILNVLALRPCPQELLPPELMDYGTESPDARRRRREARWTPLAFESI